MNATHHRLLLNSACVLALWLCLVPALVSAPLAADPWLRYPIEVFPSQTSVQQGQSISFYVAAGESLRNNALYRIQIYRIGSTDSLYADLGAGFVLLYKPLHDSLGNSLPAGYYPGKLLPREYKRGCVSSPASWPIAYTLAVPTNWKSGIYYVKCSLADNPSVSRRGLFVVKEDNPGTTSRILYKLPYSTYQAYTSWGGSSLYWSAEPLLAQNNDTVSFLRPLGGSGMTDIGAFDLAESTFVRWAERAGYVMEYCTNIDLDADVSHSFITSYKFLVTSGHDEYWSDLERSDVEVSFIKNINVGGNAAFLSGNICYWRGNYINNRTQIRCVKYHVWPDDRWRFLVPSQPEAKFIGVQSADAPGYFWTGKWDVVRLASHYLFNGTGLQNGDRFGQRFNDSYADTGIAGGEVDARASGISPANTQVLSSVQLGQANELHEGTFYIDTLSNARVFGAGSIHWSRGLRSSNTSDMAKFKTIMTNLMDHFSEKKFIGNIYSSALTPLIWNHDVEIDGNVNILAGKQLTLTNNMTLTIDTLDTLFVIGTLQVNSNITINGSGVLRVNPTGALKKNRGTQITFGPNVKFQINASLINSWNMTGIPTILSSYDTASVYPMRASTVFSYVYGSGYVPVATLDSTRGWWVKFAGAQEKPYEGRFVDSMAMNAYNGWNIIGSISSPIDSSLIFTEPSGHIASSFFKYNNGYNRVTTLQPGGGYWVKTSAPGKIILTLRSILDAGRGVPGEPDHLSDESPDPFDTYDQFTVTDATGGNQHLFVRNAVLAGTSDNIEMPPPPPDNAFDVRFSPGHYLESVTPDSEGIDLSIALNTVTYPVQLSWVINPDNGLTYTLPDGDGGLGKWNSLMGSKNMVIQNRTDGFVHLKVSNRSALENQLPTQFSLQQNYPNPFNPLTTIKYDLPVDEHVTLKVFDLLGREVYTLVDDVVKAGHQQVGFDAGQFASGVYFYRFIAGNFVQTKKLLLLK